MNMYNPYIQQMPQTQDLGGLSPYYQNIAQQQAMQNMALQQGQGLTNQAGMTVQGKQAGMNPLMMAAMLRKQPTQQEINASDVKMGGLSTYNPYSQYQVSSTYGTDPYSQQSRMLASQEF